MCIEFGLKKFSICKIIAGFTLAEVLITIGIVGVISALVLPTVFGASEVTVSKNKFKKTLAVLNEAGKMSKVQTGIDYSYVSGSAQHNKDNQYSYYYIFSNSIKGFRFLGEPYRFRDDGWTVIQNKYGVYTFVFELQDGSQVGVAGSYYRGYDANCHLEIGEVLDKTWIQAHPGCLGFIDINGADKPNKEVNCSDGTATDITPNLPCMVKKDKNYVTDLYPVVFHDEIVAPATNAAAAILKM
ncbi:MAG: type II secretion system protein [Candidatus Gastranaerophilaceae bacterium]